MNRSFSIERPSIRRFGTVSGRRMPALPLSFPFTAIS